jgi:hypothetical protein
VDGRILSAIVAAMRREPPFDTVLNHWDEVVVSPAQAVKYALFENGHHPEAIVELAREVELDMGTAPVAGNASAIRRVA